MNRIISGTYNGFNLAGTGGKIWIYNNEKEVQINRESIEKYEVIDSKSVTITNTTGKTKGKSRTSTGSMAVRGVVGGVMFGPVGAVVGAGTAKKKQKSKTYETSKQTIEREFKVLITFKDSSVVLLQLDDLGYENLLVAVFADPYITYAEYNTALLEEKRIKDKENRESTAFIFKYIVCPIIYFKLFSVSATSILVLCAIVACRVIYKRKKKA